MFGKSYREQLNFCEEQTPYVTVHGYIGKPESAKKARNEQFFFVNNRFIKHNYLHHAVVGAYEGTLPEGSHPFYVLFIDIDPSHIDINIHPTKTEIKFDDERSVYAIMMAAVRKAVGLYNLSPSLDFDSDVNFLAGVRPGPGKSSTADVKSDVQQLSAPERNGARPISPSWASGTTQPVNERGSTRNDSLDKAAGSSFDIPKKASVNNWQALYEGVVPTESIARSVAQGGTSSEEGDWLGAAKQTSPSVVDQLSIDSEPITMGSRANQLQVGLESAEEQDLPVLVDDDTIIQVQNRYLLAPIKSGMLLIDQRRAHERILYDQFHTALTKRNGCVAATVVSENNYADARRFSTGSRPARGSNESGL